jgi:hypothetical protein
LGDGEEEPHMGRAAHLQAGHLFPRGDDGAELAAAERALIDA